MHRTYLADIERGGRNITLASLGRLVQALGVPFSEFFTAMEHGEHGPSAAPDGRRKAKKTQSARNKR